MGGAGAPEEGMASANFCAACCTPPTVADMVCGRAGLACGLGCAMVSARILPRDAPKGDGAPMAPMDKEKDGPMGLPPWGGGAMGCPAWPAGVPVVHEILNTFFAPLVACA